MHNRVDHLQQKNSQIINYVHTPLLLVAMFVQMGGGGGGPMTLLMCSKDFRQPALVKCKYIKGMLF